MTAPPSNAYKIVSVPENYLGLIRQRGLEGSYVGGTEEESPWESRSATMPRSATSPSTCARTAICNILWVKGAGRDRHPPPSRHGCAMVLEGSVRYLEYDWVARPAA